MKTWHHLFRCKYPDVQLRNGEIHVWSASLDDFFSQLQTFFQVLSIDEKRRADRFRFAKDRERYIIGHGILKKIIATYSGIEPNLLQFICEKYGKPVLTHKKLLFNMSRSEGLALYAFTRNREVGIDIENIREIPEMDQIVARYFSSIEKSFFHALPECSKKNVFFQLWTRKEAYLKGVGIGLTQPLDEFDVIPLLTGSAQPLIIKGVSKRSPTWLIQDLKTISGFAAAYAVQGEIPLQCCHFFIGMPPEKQTNKESNTSPRLLARSQRDE